MVTGRERFPMGPTGEPRPSPRLACPPAPVPLLANDADDLDLRSPGSLPAQPEVELVSVVSNVRIDAALGLEGSASDTLGTGGLNLEI